MAKTIAIQLEIDGAQQAVKTIGDLETAIEQLTEELKGTDIGSERFNQLTVELNEARSALKGFEQTFEGLDPQQQTQAYIAFGESVVSGILLAQEALRTFGVENESVNAAVEKSTQAINLALQTRIVIEGALEARVIATTIAQRALNTATVAGNRVMKAFFTTVAANPFGAVLAVVGLLVTAFISLTDATDENTDATDENNEALERQNELREAQARIVQQAEAEIALARQRGITGLREELDILKQRQEALQADIPLFEDLARQQLLAINQAKFQGQATEELEAALAKTNQQLAVLKEEAGANAKIIKSLGDEIDNLAKAASAKRLQNFKDTLSDTADEVDRLNQSLLKFGDTPEPAIIEELKELIELQLKLREATEENRKSLTDILTGYITDVNESKNATDTFGETYDEVREDLSKAFQTGNIKTFTKAIEDARNEFEGKIDTIEQERALESILSGYEIAFNSLVKLGINTEEQFNDVVNPLLSGLATRLQLEGTIQFTEVDGVVEEITKVEGDINAFFERREELINQIRDAQLEGENLERLSAEDRARAIEEATKLAEDQADAILEIITNTVAAEDAIRGVLGETQKLTSEVTDASNDFDELFGLIITNFDAITEEFDIAELLDPDPAKVDENLGVLTDFFKNVSNGLIDLETLTQEQRLEILEEFLEKRKELIEQNAKDEVETTTQTTEEILGNLQEVLSSISQIGSALAENSRFQISVIQRETEQLLDQVVGDTQEAADLREEIQEDATRKIVELERQAELRSLQFAKIEAISQLAVATVRALALPPPFNAIAAAAVGTAGSLQIGLIQAQIEDLKSVPAFAQGGLVQGQGNGTSDSIPALLSNGEFVVNANSTKQFLPLLEELNQRGLQRFAQGGFVLDSGSSNPIFMGNTSFDDSRIIDALERRDTTPLRAYVFEKEITDAQDIERRLQELSKL